MKKLRLYILLLFTFTALFAVTLLPRRISELRDQKLTGVIHTEVFTADDIMPIRDLSLTERIELLSLWSLGSDSLLISIQQEPAGGVHEELLHRELQNLAGIGIVPEDLAYFESSDINCTKMHLQQDISGADFLRVEAYIMEDHISVLAIFDAESEQILWLELIYPNIEKYLGTFPASYIGFAFFDRLGIEHHTVYENEVSAILSIADSDLEYIITITTENLSISPLNYESSYRNNSEYDG